MKCDNCRYTKMCVRRFHTMGDTVNCGHYEEYEQRPHGKWINRRIIAKNRSFDMVVCSNCQAEFSYDAETGVSMDNYNTCPNCGADMRGKKDEN